MTEFWEASFRDKQTMWGMEPADCAVEAAELFGEHGLETVLVPGFGYGRNAKVFVDRGFEVTGIEISQTAIDLAKEHDGETIQVYHGPVSEMPFDDEVYDGVFCYALIHLLDVPERAKLIQDCYNQLRSGGFMVFVAISKSTAAYGQGKQVGPDTFLTPHGVTIFYYDRDAVDQEFGGYGMVEAKEITEPVHAVTGKPFQRFWWVICRKERD